MTSLSAKERLRYLRKKNEILLDKLESRSSKIETELSTLKCAMRGKEQQKKSSPKEKDRCKAWSKRNNSHQVSEALNSYGLNETNSSASSPNSYHSTGRPNMHSDQETEKKIDKPVEIKSVDDRPQSAYKCIKKLDKNISNSGHSQVVHDILSSIDYSPKSKFLRKMKSRSEDRSTLMDVNMRSNVMKRSNQHSELRCKTSNFSRRKKRKLAAAAIESPDSSHTSAFTGCLKELESSVDGISSRKQSMLCACYEKDSKIELIKKFRDYNWDDCHANNLVCSHNEKTVSGAKNCYGLPPDLHICNERYMINNRLFPVPVESNCDGFVCCTSQEQKAQKTFGAIPKQVVVTVPTSLLETGGSFGGRNCEKLNCNENKPLSSALVQKLFRIPKPVNSMALRYQKGMH